MIIDENYFELMDALDELCRQLKENKTFLSYRQAKEEMHNSKEVEQLKETFQEAKNAFEIIQPYGKYAPDYFEKQKNVLQEKRKLDLHPLVSEFRIRQTELQQELDEISQRIAKTVSEGILVESGNPFFEKNHHCKH